MINTKERSQKAKGSGYAMNSKVLRTCSINLSDGGSRRRRRRFPSRVVRTSRDLSLLSDYEGTSISPNMSSSRFCQSKESVEQYIPNVKPNVRYSAAFVPPQRLEVDEKQSNIDCEYFTLKPVFRHLPSCPDLSWNLKAATRTAILLPRESRLKQRVSFSPRKQVFGSFVSSTSRTGWSNGMTSMEDDDDILPPYHKMVPQMFYRFAGISPFSNSNQLQSRADFKQLMTCLDMQQFFEDCLTLFPKPKLNKTNLGYITFDMFYDLFSCKFAQIILEVRWQYETLCSAILTMECLDKKKLNRIGFPQFLRLYRALYGSDISVEKVNSEFNKYDLDNIGFLTIVNIFNFCVEEDLDIDE
jgi:hypothetical protein